RAAAVAASSQGLVPEGVRDDRHVAAAPDLLERPVHRRRRPQRGGRLCARQDRTTRAVRPLLGHRDRSCAGRDRGRHRRHADVHRAGRRVGRIWQDYRRHLAGGRNARLFAGLPSGNQKVWLKYTALDTQMISPGFQTCSAGDPATRIAETYAIVTTAPAVVQQNDGVVLNGVAVPDPRNMLIAFDAAAAVVLDGSAPHQLFPDDSAEWLVPVGIVSYNSATGTFNARTPAQLALNRVTRRYAGTVVESVLAADGVLRLRDR